DPQRLQGTAVTPEFFRTLDVRPLIGRAFNDEDARERAPRTVILSYELWQTMFGGRLDVVTNTIRLDTDTYSVIGVMPPDFFFPIRGGQLWVPLVLGDPPKDARDNLYVNAIARLKTGVSIEKARAEVSLIADGLAREYPKENDKVGAGVEPLDT